MNSIRHLYGILLIGWAIFLAGCAAGPIQPETGQPTALSATKPVISSTTTPTPLPVQPQKLRITNQSTFTLQSLHVRFPDEMVEFGDVQPGATTDFMLFTRGVYRYAAYQVLVNGKEYQQPVMDWVGEKPMDGEAFTYILEADPARWTTEGQVIRLVAVRQETSPPGGVTQLPQAGHFPAFDRFQMFDEHSGWAIASETLQILRTTDGGLTWQDVTPAGIKPAWFAIGSAYFLNVQMAWIPTGGKTYRTTDGGQTWQEFANPFHLVSLQFIDPQTGWAVADPYCGASTCWERLFQTADGGQTWNVMKIQPPDGPQTVPTSMPPDSIHTISGDTFKFSDPTTLWVGGNDIVSSPDAILQVSRDRGQTWQKQEFLKPQSLQNSSMPVVEVLPTFLTATDGFFALKVPVAGGKEGANLSYEMVVYATQDGGRTWEIRPTLVHDVGFMDEIDFVSLQDAFVRCGDGLCVTQDGAQTWQTVQSNLLFDSGGNRVVTAFDFVDARTGWAIAPSVISNKLYQTLDGGVTWNAINAVVISDK